MEADGAPSTPPASVSFTGIQSYGYMDQGKVEADVRSLKIKLETSCSKSRTLKPRLLLLMVEGLRTIAQSLDN